MPDGSYELVRSTDGGYTARISARGMAVLASPMINRGTAFTRAERAELGLVGLLPSGVSTLDGQLRRTYGQYCGLARALDLVGERWALLVVRELLLGPKRFTDLLDGLPGVSTNVLATRLRQLE